MTDIATAPVARADAAVYAAALEGAALYDSSALGRIWMRDRDRAALLHRLSTNQIEKLAPGQGTQTVLTTPIGRIVDLLTVYALEGALLLTTSPGRGPAIFAHLKKNIFFNDKLKVEDATAALGQLTLYGPRAAEALAAAGLPGAGLPEFGITAASYAGETLYVARTLPVGGAGLSLIAPPAALAELRAALRAWGAALLDEATHDVLRVEQGYGAYGRELSLEYIPLETGLWGAVSFNKGCYVGQEIIARMESRGRLAKQLRGLRFAAPPELPAAPQTPLAKLEVAGKEAGDLTSLAESPRHGLIGLAYVRTAHAEPGTAVRAGGAEATVVELPFTT
jgi:folate-binding protein YgfZ